MESNRYRDPTKSINSKIMLWIFIIILTLAMIGGYFYFENNTPKSVIEEPKKEEIQIKKLERFICETDPVH